MRNKAAWCLLAVFLLSYLPGDAQVLTGLNRYRKNERKEKKFDMALHKRLYVGVYGWQFMSNPMSIRVRDTRYFDQLDFDTKTSGYEIDTSFTVQSRMVKSLSAYLGTSVPLAMPTDKSMLCLDIEANVLAGALTYDTVRVPLYYKDLALAETIPFMVGSVPVSFNYKYGGDASLSKDHRTLLSAGAGIATSYIMIDDGTSSEALIKAVPFVKAEVGFVLGVAIKLRGTAYLGNYNLIDYTSPEVTTAMGVIERKYSGPLGYNLSVIVMPLSLGWEKAYVR